MTDTLKEQLNNYDHLLIANGLDEAIIGVALSVSNQPVVAYNISKVVEILMRDGMDEEEAAEYFEYNILGAYVGENTPIFIDVFS